MVTHLKIDQAAQGQRIDNFLITHCKGVPKSRLYRSIRQGEIRVNKKRIKPDYRLCLQDEVRIPPFVIHKTVKNISNRYHFLLDCIEYEDNDWILINKPSGIPVHSGSFLHVGIIEALTKLRQDLRYLRLVHRLDRETSGCLLLAKKRSALIAVQSLMLKQHIKKQYYVLVKGNFSQRKKVIDLPLKKNQLMSGERIVKIDEAGKNAKTIFTLKQQFLNASLLEATLITGRTHQIRVHAKAMDYPVAGDDKYGDRQFNKEMKALGLNRLFLHAYFLAFRLNDKKFKFELPLPDALRRVINQLGSISH